MQATEYEYIDDEADEVVEVNRRDIEACSSEAELARWFTSMHNTRVRIEAAIEARKLLRLPDVELSQADESWFIRSSHKCAHLRVGMKIIENRMLALGYFVPWPPSDPRNRHIVNLEKKNARLRDLLHKHGISIPEAA